MVHRVGWVRGGVAKGLQRATDEAAGSEQVNEGDKVSSLAIDKTEGLGVVLRAGGIGKVAERFERDHALDGYVLGFERAHGAG